MQLKIRLPRQTADLRRGLRLPLNLTWLSLPGWWVLAGPLMLMAPFWLGGRVMFWGTPLLQFAPWRWLAWENLSSGFLPLWNSLNGMGAPLAANYQAAFFYPPTWIQFGLAAVGGLPALAWGQGVLVALHLAWAGLGMTRLAARLGMRALGQSIAGLAFGLSTYLAAISGFPSMNAAAAWLPWVLLFAGELAWPVEDRRARRASFLKLSGALAMLLLAGHAQTAWYTLQLAAAWVVFVGLRAALPGGRPGFKRRLGAVARGVVGLGLASLLAATLAGVQLAPTAEYLAQSQRSSEVGFEFAMTYSFWPWRLLGLFAPGLFGSPVQGDYRGYGAYWEDAVYIGLLPLILALGAVFSSRRQSAGQADAGGRRAWFSRAWQILSTGRPGALDELAGDRWLAWFLAGVSGVGFVLALGKNTAVFPWLYKHAPTFDLFQAPARYLLWVTFSLALLAGIGAEGIRPPSAHARRRMRLAVVAAAGVTLGAGLGRLVLGEVSASLLRATAQAGLWALAGIGLLLAAPEHETGPAIRIATDEQAGSAGSDASNAKMKRPFLGVKQPAAQLLSRAWWPPAVVALVLLDLLAANWGVLPAGDAALYAPSSPALVQLRQELDGGRVYLPPLDERQLKFNRYFRFDTFDPEKDWQGVRAALLPDTNLLDGIALANNFDPLLPGRYAGWMARLPDLPPNLQARLLALMDVRLVERTAHAQPNLVGLAALDGAQRVRWLPCAAPAENEQQAWELLLADDFEINRQVIVEGRTPFEGPLCTPADAAQVAGQARVMPGGDPTLVRIQVRSAQDGWLLLSDTWYPGWQAEIDGAPAQIQVGDVLFRAVAVPAGDHDITFSYRPRSFSVGLALSLVSGLALSGGWILQRKKGRRFS